MNSKIIALIGLVLIVAVAGYLFQDDLLVDREASLLSAEAQFAQGELFENGWGRPKDTREAIRYYELASQNDHAEAQFRLANLYYTGERVQQDLHKALDYYLQAAKNGHVEAEYQLGWMYQRGEGVDVDRVEAEKWFSLAREQGHDKVPPKQG